MPRKGKKSPAKAEAQRRRWADPVYRAQWIAGAKARWATPEWREKMTAAGWRPVTAEDWQEEKARVGDGPSKWSRLGIPTGMTRVETEKLWAQAEQQADTAIRGLEARGIVPAVVVPDSDEAMAKAALREVVVIALGPAKDKRVKARALRTLLQFTKPKPAPKIETKMVNVEEWLKTMAQDGQ